MHPPIFNSMANDHIIFRWIDEGNKAKLIEHILSNKIMDASLALKCWDAFLPMYEFPRGTVEIDDLTLEQIDKDLARSFHHYKDIDSNEIPRHREKLRKLMVRLFERPFYTSSFGMKKWLHYYQSYHDIASVIYINFGCKNALAMLYRLSRSHFCEWMDQSFEPTRQFCHLVIEILRRHDRETADYLGQIEMPPYFFVSWILSWCSHEFETVEQSIRLFNCLIFLPPATIGYISAVLIYRSRSDVLRFNADSSDFGVLHQQLKALPKTRWDNNVIYDALRLMKLYPPSQMVTLVGLEDTVFNSNLDFDPPNGELSTLRSLFSAIGIPVLVLILCYILAQYLRLNT